MVTKNIEILNESETISISYTKDIIDKNEIQFSVFSVKSKTEKIIRIPDLMIHYYPLQKKNKTSMPIFQDEVHNKLKIKIASAIILSETNFFAESLKI